MKRVLVTGCSSGFGLETAKYFLNQGWQVVATMRTPNPSLFVNSENLKIIALDVTKEDSIQRAVSEAGPIDVLVNNAGVGMLCPLEGASMTQIRSLFETNVFGTMAMIQAVLPQMRERKSGVIVNVTSSVTSRPLPLLSVYTASKAAVNAFAESLQLELEAFNIQVRNILPGRAPETKFGENARANMTGDFPTPYQPLLQKVIERFQIPTDHVTHAEDVATAIYQAATDPSSVPMRFPAGVDAQEEEAQRRAERR